MLGMRLNWQLLLHKKYALPVIWDVLMLIIVSVNLTWLFMDSLYSRPLLNAWFAEFLPNLYNMYEVNFHRNFPLWDLIFVAIYVVDIACCWCVSIVKNTYYRWWFYPFVRWYDVLGSLPLSGFRFLRLFRAVSLLYRIQRYGILDVSQTFLYRFVNKYFLALVEEVSDRVVVSVLEGLAKEVRAGNPVMHRMMTDVMGPHRHELAQWLGDRLTDLVENSYLSRKDAAAQYIRHVVHQAVFDSEDIAKIVKVPAIGEYMVETLEKTIAEISHAVVHRLALDLHGEQSTGLIHEAAEVLFNSLSEPGGQMNQIIESVLLGALDVIKAEVQIQKWKQKKLL